MNTITLNKISRISQIILLGLMFITTGCKKDDTANPYNGTVWKYMKSGDGYQYETIITFQAENYKYEETDNYNGSISSYTGQGIYSYDNQNIHLNGNIAEGSGTSSAWSADGTVSGNQMILVIYNSSFVFVKQ